MLKMLDTTAIAPMDLTEWMRNSSVVRKLKEDAGGKARRTRKKFVDSKVAEDVRQGAAEKDARQKWIAATGERPVLTEDYQIHLQDGTICTVGDILADPDKFDGKHCADPGDPNYQDDDRIATIYAHDGNIHSFARHGLTYVLRLSAKAEFADEQEFFREEAEKDATFSATDLEGYLDEGFVSIGRIAPCSIPQMRWIIPGFLQPGEITLLGGQGGVGKSLHAWSVGVAVATGTAFGWWPAPEEARRVLVLSGEDDKHEISRRVSVACKAVNRSVNELGDNFLVWGRRDIRLAIKEQKTGTISATPLWGIVKKAVRDLSVGLLIIDPLVRAGEGFEENDNVDQDQLFQRIQDLTTGQDCAILLDDHFAKGGGADDQNSIRGASAKVNASRVAVTLTQMTEAVHSQLRPPKPRRSYVLFSMPKTNYSGRPEGDRWLEFRDLEVGNGETRPALIWRDLVAAREFFDPFAWEHKERFLQIVGDGRNGEPWRAARNAARASRLDVAIAEALELSEAEAVAYIAEFEKHGLIEQVPHKSRQRNTSLVWRCTGVTDREECSELK
jgi:hypothetical protein